MFSGAFIKVKFIFCFLFRSAFFWFSCEERPKVRISNPDYGAAETAKELGARWAQVDKETKERYEQKAMMDRARYDKVCISSNRIFKI